MNASRIIAAITMVEYENVTEFPAISCARTSSERIRKVDAHIESVGSRIDLLTLHLLHRSSLPSRWTQWRGLRGIRSFLMANKAGGVERRTARDCRINWL